MQISEQSIIGELVSFDYRTARIFKQNGIDFCCNGNRTIAEACHKKNIDSSVLIETLKQSLQQKDTAGVDYKNWPADLLADYIEKKHHRYVQEKILEIRPLLSKVVKVHGVEHPELEEVYTLFEESSGELTAHMKKEELILFPYVRKLVQDGAPAAHPAFGTVENPIRMMMHEHDGEGERFRKISMLTNNYTAPADACNTFRVSYALLKEFEEDLHMHIHLENNILFPQAIALERKLVS